MWYSDTQEVLQLVADHYTAGEIVDLMNYTSEELLELIGPDVLDNLNVFELVMRDLDIEEDVIIDKISWEAASFKETQEEDSS